MLNSKILFATTTRNPSKKFIKSIKKMYKIGKKFSQFKILIIESDSSQKYHSYLNSFLGNNNIEIIKLGNLKSQIKYGDLRTARIAFARNTYLRYLKKHKKYQTYDYLIAFDSDGISNLISYNKICEAISIKKDWSAQFPNQLIFYYDIYALRSKNWVEENYKITRDRYLSEGFSPKDAIVKSLSNKIIHINKNRGLIPVQSAFGGFGIYKVSRIGNSEYIGTNNGSSKCEHVSFNKEINKNYPDTLFINPKLISGLGFPDKTFRNKILMNIIPSFIFSFLYKILKRK
jgi:hypothetical protein